VVTFIWVLKFIIARNKKDETPENIKWYKILAPQWTDNNGNITRYSVSYVPETTLKDIEHYKVLEIYSDRKTMISSI
jgi:hypothetical protein